MDERSFPEMLLLLATAATGGQPGLWRVELGRGLAGAILVELALSGRIAFSPGPDGKVVVRDADRVGDPAADVCLGRLLFEDRAHSPRAWVERLADRALDETLTRLLDRGDLVSVTTRVLGIPSGRRCSGEPRRVAEAAARMRAVVDHGTRPDPRTAALIGILCAMGLEHAVFPGLPRVTARARLDRLTAGPDLAVVSTAVSAVTASLDATATALACVG
ncbi:GOLPH3/VPS74 family protein [Streptomyces syringium]|uniref:GOLPH3/VPS74 family protein n=1 Tax=Streptomyces syringium TaxID=76729 RepID=UPI003416FF49